MSDSVENMSFFRLLGIIFLPIAFGWKVIKKDSGYSKNWKIITYIMLGLFTFAIVASVIKGQAKRVSVNPISKTIYIS